MSLLTLETTALALLTPGKGILAMDESMPTIGKRLHEAGVENTPGNRRAWRELLLTTPTLSEYISGAILYDETLNQSAHDGTPFPMLMTDCGIIPGIKVDAGAQQFAGHTNEKITEGLDHLRDRLEEYIAAWAPVSPNGVPSSRLVLAYRRGPVSRLMLMHWHATQRCARKPLSCRSWSRKCCSTEITASNAVMPSVAKRYTRCSSSCTAWGSL